MSRPKPVVLDDSLAIEIKFFQCSCAMSNAKSEIGSGFPMAMRPSSVAGTVWFKDGASNIGGPMAVSGGHRIGDQDVDAGGSLVDRRVHPTNFSGLNESTVSGGIRRGRYVGWRKTTRSNLR
jgi:hypothetical protein